MNIYLQNADIVQHNMVAVPKDGLWIVEGNTVHVYPGGKYIPINKDLLEDTLEISLDDQDLFTKLSNKDVVALLKSRYPEGSIVLNSLGEACKVTEEYNISIYGISAIAINLVDKSPTNALLYRETWTSILNNPIAITEEGNKCYGGEKCYLLSAHSGWRIDEITVGNRVARDERLGTTLLLFSKNENASDYKYRNQPRYSMQDLMDATHNGLIALAKEMPDEDVDILKNAIIDQLDKNE